MNYFIDAVTTNYWNFKGRSSRTAYWMFTLASIILNIFATLNNSFIPEAFAGSILKIIFSLLLICISIFVFIPSLFVSIRRVHDNGYSGWYLLIPIFNLYLIILSMFARGTVGANNYGEDPTDTPNGTTNPEKPVTPVAPLATPVQS